MVEETSPATDEQHHPAFAIQRIYVKDMSFEAPNTPQVFLEEWKPQLDIELHNRSTQVGNDTHEVVLRIAVTAKIGQHTAFLAEIQQAGLFTITGSTPDQLGPIVGSFCPSILFPYAREAISNLVTRGGFPALNLAPINFEAAYQHRVQQMQQTKGDGTAAAEARD